MFSRIAAILLLVILIGEPQIVAGHSMTGSSSTTNATPASSSAPASDKSAAVPTQGPAAAPAGWQDVTFPAHPNSLHECDIASATVRVCGSWVWNPKNYEYDAHWENGSIGRIVLVDFGSDRIFLRRFDFAGATESAHAIYVGKWSGDHVEAAQEQATINKSMNSAGLAWSATATDQSGSGETHGAVPSTMTVCVFDKEPCRVWRFTGRTGKTVAPSGRPENLLIDRFDAQDVAFHGLDISLASIIDIVYTGHRHGNEIDGDVTWTWNRGTSESAVGKWYATIETSANPTPQTARADKLDGIVCKELPFGFAPIMSAAPPIGGVSCAPHGSESSSTYVKATPRPIAKKQTSPAPHATPSPTVSSQLQAAQAEINAMVQSHQITSSQAEYMRAVLARAGSMSALAATQAQAAANVPSDAEVRAAEAQIDAALASKQITTAQAAQMRAMIATSKARASAAAAEKKPAEQTPPGSPTSVADALPARFDRAAVFGADYELAFAYSNGAHVDFPQEIRARFMAGLENFYGVRDTTKVNEALDVRGMNNGEPGSYWLHMATGPDASRPLQPSDQDGFNLGSAAEQLWIEANSYDYGESQIIPATQMLTALKASSYVPATYQPLIQAVLSCEPPDQACVEKTSDALRVAILNKADQKQ